MPGGRACDVPQGATCVPPTGRVCEVRRGKACEVWRGCGCGVRRGRTFEQWPRGRVKCREAGFVCRQNKECVAVQQQLSPRKELAAGSSLLECRGAGTDLAQGHPCTGPMSRRVVPSLTGKLMGCSCWANVAGHPGDVFAGSGGGGDVRAFVSHNFCPFSCEPRQALPAISFILAVAGPEVQQLSPRPHHLAPRPARLSRLPARNKTARQVGGLLSPRLA